VEHPESLKSMHSLAALYRDEGKYAQAEPLLTKALEARRRVLGDDHPDTLTSMSDLALLYEKQGKYTEAESLLLKVLGVRQRVLGSKHPDTATALTLLTQIRLQQKKYAEAEPVIREALNRYDEKIPDSWRRYHSQSLLGASLAGQGKYAEAEPSLLAGYQGMLQRQATIPADHRSDLQRAAEWIVQLYQDWGKPDKAAEWRGVESLGRK
jgi:tetratricopeptide (TPR) repeat protein